MIKFLSKLSLTCRVVLFVMLLEILLVASFAVYNYQHTKYELLKGFNSSLKIKTDDLIKLFKYNYRQNFIKTFIKSDEIFALYSSERGFLMKSDNFKLPDLKANFKNANFLSFSCNGINYRILIKKLKLNKNDYFYIIYGRPLKDVYHEINESKWLLVYSSLIFIVISFIIIIFSVKKGLAPLYKFLDKTKSITPEDFNKEITYEDCINELKPVVESFNLLLKKANNALKREKEFSENAAHELRTPITVLKSSIQTEILLYKKNNEKTLFLESLLEDVNKLNEICEALLDSSVLTEIDSKEYLSFSEFKNEIKNSLSLLKKLDVAKSKDISFMSMGSGDNLQLHTNIYVVRQIVINLLKNALKYGGNKISLIIKPDKNFILLSVFDNGYGVPENEKELIFERFYRSKVNFSNNSESTGLGLSVCKNLANNYKGDIFCENVKPKGIVFTWKVLCQNTK